MTRRSLTQRILVSGGANLTISVVGFLGTVYFARTLGSATLGTFALGIGLVKWLQLADAGVTNAVIKRLSEGRDRGQFLTATVLLQGGIAVAALLGVALWRDQLNSYIGGEFAWLIAALFLLNYAGFGIIAQTLRGHQLVHVATGLNAVERFFRVAFQAGLVALGFGVLGLFGGMVLSLFAVIAVGGVILARTVSVTPVLPERHHVESLLSYTKYSVFNVLSSQMFSWMDVLVLGFFVSNGAIGVYKVSWSVSMTFLLLSGSLRENLFPEVSSVDADGDPGRVKSLLEESLVYAGVLPFAGIVGSAVVGGGVLGVYGPEFRAGTTVLVVLLIVSLLRSYEMTFRSVLNGLDRPELTFRIDVLFAVSNLALNVVLIWQFGILGAAVASVVSMALAAGLGWWMVQSLLDATIPVRETGVQVLSAGVMGAVVYGATSVLSPAAFPQLVALIGLGGVIYVAVLLTLSPTVRKKALTVAGAIQARVA